MAVALQSRRTLFLLGVALLGQLLGTSAGPQTLRNRGILREEPFPVEASDADGLSSQLKPHTCNAVNGLSQRQIEGALQRKCRVLCEMGDKNGCNEMLEPCMGIQRVRHAQKLQSYPGDSAESVQDAVQIAPADVTFVVFFAVGKRNAEAYPNHQYVEPDMNFLRVLRITHPGSRVVMLSDEWTMFPPDMDIEIFRVPMDSEKMGRNAYANYYQYIGQKVFLQHLKANASREHVVFMDMDVLVLDSIVEVFCSDYGYGLTINANDYDPVDIGLQFVQSSFYDEAIGFLQELIDRYLGLIGHPNSFTTGQVVMRNTLDMGHKDVMIPKIATSATKNNVHCRMVQGGKHRVCFFPCLRYNYWEDCTASLGNLLPQDPALFREHGVKVMQFVAWRKPGLQVVADAFVAEGLDGAYRAFASLPHTEDEYKRRFASFNAHVTKVCYKDDKGCKGVQFDDEGTLWQRQQQQQKQQQ